MPSPLDYAETAIFLNKMVTPDGMGGWITIFTEGAEFPVLVELSGSVTQLVAEQRGFSGSYNITVHKDLPIDFHNVFKLKQSGRILRVTQDPDEQIAPESSTLDYKVGTAEKFTLPVG